MNIYNYIFAYIFIYLSVYLAIYLLLMLEFMVDLPQEGIWKQKFLDAGGIPFACLCLGSRISCDHPGSAQGRSCGESGAGVQWWFSSCPVCSCRWKHQKRHWGALWTPPWEQITCVPQLLGQQSAFLPPLTPAAPLLILLPCYGKVHFCS